MSSASPKVFFTDAHNVAPMCFAGLHCYSGGVAGNNPHFQLCFFSFLNPFLEEIAFILTAGNPPEPSEFFHQEAPNAAS